MFMNLTLLKCKIHRAKVTQCDLTYEGSLTIDVALMEEAGILPYEQIDVLNINSGKRFTTYAIEGARNSGIIGVNGAAARLCQKDDLVIVNLSGRHCHHFGAEHLHAIDI